MSESNNEIVQYSGAMNALVSGLEDNSAKSDFDEVRNNLLDLLSSGKETLNILHDAAIQSGDAEMYAALATLMKTMIAGNKQLLETHKQIRDIENPNKRVSKEQTITSPTQINANNVIVGLPMDIMNALKNLGKNDPNKT